MVLDAFKFPDKVSPIIRYNGIFDFDKLYRDMAAWFGKNGFELQEDNYKHKTPMPIGCEQEIKWKGWLKTNEYARYWIHVHFHIWDLQDIEVVKDGVKKKMSKGKLFIILSIQLDLDYSNRFKGKSGILLQNLLRNYIMKKTIENSWQDELVYRMYKLHEVIKESLGMESCYNSHEHWY